MTAMFGCRKAPRGLVGTVTAACVLLAAAPTSHADFQNWQTGETIQGTEGITPRPNIDLSNWSRSSRNLRFADFSGGLDLTDSSF